MHRLVARLDVMRELVGSVSSGAPTTRKDDTPLNRKPGGLMEQSNASLQRGDKGLCQKADESAEQAERGPDVDPKN